MRNYQIRVIATTGKLSLLSQASYFSDFAAIRAAQALCKAGQRMEVWQGDTCIYNGEIKNPADRSPGRRISIH